uniref:diguanylate cyclase n=1 Tax=Acidobacterium capsulatum TaxID=33075 RepID=A0A7V4XQK6_9BACT
MSAETKSIDSQRGPSSLRLSLLAFVLTFATGLLSLTFSRHLSHLNPIWWSNGVLLAAVLAARKRTWPMLLAAGGVAILLAHVAVVHTFGLAVVLIDLCNLLEVLVAAWVLRVWMGDSFDLRGAEKLWRFVLTAVLIAPCISGIFATLLHHYLQGVPFLQAMMQWYFADALGIATATPVAFALYRGRVQDIWRKDKSRQNIPLLLLLSLATLVCFLQPSVAFLFLLFPALLVVAVQTGWTGSGTGVLLIALIAVILTGLGYGPMASLGGVSLRTKTVDLQLFLASCSICATIVSAIFEERRKLLKLAIENERRFRSLAENSPDVMVLTDLEGRRIYVSSAARTLLGWSPKDLLGKTYQSGIVHPDDVPALEEALNDVRRTGEGRTLTYRCQHKDGSYLWVEASLMLHRDMQSHEPVGFVNVVRDITSRKAAEERMQRAYVELQALAEIDALTGVANRRHFDKVLEAEWKRAIRTGAPTALLLIDVDWFKNYNDIYGHLEGDVCLRSIATWISVCIHRSTDLVARFGGEEFAVILPDTDETGAAALGERIREEIEARKVMHRGNEFGHITISAGCASLMPMRGTSGTMLIDAADKALYRAKSSGRNRVVRATEEQEPRIGGAEDMITST